MSGEGVRVPARVGVPVFDEQVDRLEGCVRQLSVMRERILAGVTPGELTGPCPKRLALAEEVVAVTAETNLRSQAVMRRLEIRLLLEPGALWVSEYYPVEEAVEQPDGRLRVLLRFADPAWLVRLVLGLGGGATVLAPPELAAAVVARAEEALAVDAGGG